MEPFKIDLPIYLEKGVKKKKNIPLNLNHYRNANFHELNYLKTTFESVVGARISHLPPMTRATLTYTLFFGSNREVDVNNVISIVDKFFCDTLVNLGKLRDDNRKVIAKTINQWGGVDPKNPRVEVTFSDYELVEEEPPMQIILTQPEIEQLIQDHVSQLIREGQTISIDFKTTRGDDGVIANITVSKGEVAQPSSTVTGNRRVRQPAPARPEPEAAVAAASPPSALATGMTTLAEHGDDAKLSGNVVPVEEPVDPPFQTEEAPTAPQAAVQPIVAPGSLFPSKESSSPTPAPVAAPAPTPAPVADTAATPVAPAATAPKSLFANLTKPTNGPSPAAQ
jgi:hypothetical protein